ncbi:MAG TPA: phytanoyl-CoA dioxygenase family protein [Acidobacteriaceae bacterium]|nr:phytanoyl-CoA dioxygenase family protein [Acidobacteriaceae bacterium]
MNGEAVSPRRTIRQPALSPQSRCDKRHEPGNGLSTILCRCRTSRPKPHLSLSTPATSLASRSSSVLFYPELSEQALRHRNCTPICPRESEDAPLLAFILMIDAFRKENGATRFIPTSDRWPGLPGDHACNTGAAYSGEILGCGNPGTMILFNGAIWHGHTANITAHSCRSIQGYFVRRNARAGFDFRNRLLPAARIRRSHLAQYLLALHD